MEKFKSGFVSIIGRTNVGKSTLINSLVGEKIAITANKSQTTRTVIKAIINNKNSQIIFTDTPGIHKPKTKLGTTMNDNAWSTIPEVDIILFIVEATSNGIGKGDQMILEKLKESNKKAILVINKIDLTTSMISSGTKAINMILSIVPLMCLWLGTMKIAESSGLLDIISKKLSKVVRVIFPEIPDGDPSISYISSNIVMNMLGLGNAATPFGIKAMTRLKELNNNSDIASRSMITFLVINTSSVTIIPTTVISLRIASGSNNPTEIMTACIITTFLSSFIGLLIDRLFYFIWRRHYV